MKYYAGIDLGGTFVKLGILDEQGNIIIKSKIPTQKELSASEIIKNICGELKNIIAKTNIDIESIGIGIPGIPDNENGAIIYAENLGWYNIPLRKEMQKIIDKPVYICNDASGAALGEYFCGASKNYSSSVLLTLGTGVGSGIIIDGKLFDGFKSAGGEFGHTVIRVNGEKCSCGRRGCLEAYASVTALLKQTKSALSKDKEKQSILWSLSKGNLENIDGEMISKAVRQNDKIAKKIWNKYTSYVAEGVLNVFKAFRPNILLIGGGISGAGDLLLSPIKRKVNKYLKESLKYAPAKLEIASLKNDAGLCGAVKFAIDSNK